MTQESVRCTDCKNLKRIDGEYVCAESNFVISRSEINDRMLCAQYREKKGEEDGRKKTA
jgi:hypothetical protein